MNINDLTCSVAEDYDIDGIMAIEENFFKEKEISYKREDIIKWMNFNRNMFYVVRDTNNQVVAFTILVPITEDCYCKFKQGKNNDLDKLQLGDIVPYMESDYYYFADVACLNKDANASMIIFRTVLPFLIENTKYIVTTPVTKEGQIKASKLCAKNTFGESSLELGVPCYIKVEEAIETAKRMIAITDKFIERSKGKK